MSGLRERAIGFFLTPESPADAIAPSRDAVVPAPDAVVPPRADVRGPVEPPTAAVLGAVHDASAVAALVSAELRLRRRASCVVLAQWRFTEQSSRQGVASRSARRLAQRLAVRDLDAEAHNRTVQLRLPADPSVAAGAWRRALAAADCPAVLAVAGPRPAELEALFGELDLLVLALPASASPDLAELALAGLPPGRAVAIRSPSLPIGLARALSSSSIATSRLLGGDVAAALRGLA